MSIQTLEAEIAKLRDRFRTLNQEHFHKRGYVFLSEAKEEKLGQLADEIDRLQFTRSVLLANAKCTSC